MSRGAAKRVVDTNVPATANLAVVLDSIEVDKLGCVLACVAAIQEVVNWEGSLSIRVMKSLTNTEQTFQ